MNHSILGGRSSAEQQYPQTTTATDRIEASAAAKIGRAMDAADELAGRVAAMVDVICGPGMLVNSEITRVPAPSPDGVLPRLAARATELQVVVAAAHAALDRIDRELT